MTLLNYKTEIETSIEPILEEKAIALDHVSKIYKMYPSLAHRAIDVLGINRFFKKKNYPEFRALDDISFAVKKGERVGIIGRNGSGKTTLLRLLTQNYAPSSGDIQVHGNVQALMQIGLGFHPEFSGIENVKSSLIYNGLPEKEFEAAIQDIIDFTELGDFINQPVKNYSLGMLSRLQFAAATAIQPEILIVDEILGAGDAYFSAKSADRMQKLTHSGCTLLLVSHSNQQILQFCERVIWLNAGKIVMDDDALKVIKKYEEYISHLSANREENEKEKIQNEPIVLEKWLQHKIAEKIPGSENLFQQTSGGVSRWKTKKSLKINNVVIKNEKKEPQCIFQSGDPLVIEIEFYAEETKHFRVKLGIVLFTRNGQYLARHVSDYFELNLVENQHRLVTFTYPSLFLGNGEYIFSVSLHGVLDLENLSTATTYDIHGRSYQFKVMDKYVTDETLFHHPCIWTLNE